MKKLFFAIVAVLLIAGCQDRKQESAASTTTSPGGISYTRLYIPETSKVSLQIAFPSNWATRDGVNPAASYVGADLVLAGGAEGYPAGEVVETFSDLKAEARLSVTPDFVFGQLEVDTKNLMEAVKIANAHLAKPTLATNWLGRVAEGFAGRVTEISAQPGAQAFNALRWAVFGNTQLRKSLSLDEAGIIDRKSTRLNSSHPSISRMPSSA